MDNIVVGVRVRPLNEREKSSPGFSHAWHVTNKSIQRSDNETNSHSPSRPSEPQTFLYDSVFEPSSTNDDVYDNIAAPIVESALGGYNSTIFAYGQTSSGKTHTMLGSDEDPGVTPRAIEHVLRHAAASKTRKFMIRASYVEIYNDKIHDLRNAAGSDLAIRQDKAGRVYVEAEEAIVSTLEDAMNILEEGQKSRHVGGTNMNARSSRSHTVFSLMIESKDDVGTDRTIRASTLNLVDLAGSERLKSTGAEGKRMKEGAHINKSLLVLGTIINKLSKAGSDPSKLGHLPYRESKLTRLLRPALGGNSKTAVLCAITPSNLHVEETLSTLKFAERAKKITNAAERNEITDYRAKYKQTAIDLAVLQEKYAALEAEHMSIKKNGVPVSGTDEGEQYISPESTLSDVSSLQEASAEEISVVVTAPSMAEVVGLRLDVENLKEELEYMKKHVDEVEIENEHLRAQMRKKNGEYRDLRTRTVELRQAARSARQKERETCRALVLAFTKLEEARSQLEASRKKGSHVKVAEALLDELSLSLLDWLPQQQKKRRYSSASANSSSSNDSQIVVNYQNEDGQTRQLIAKEIGRDSQRGKAIMAQIATVAKSASGSSGSSSTGSATFSGAIPSAMGPAATERRRRARTLPEDLVLDIDEGITITAPPSAARLPTIMEEGDFNNSEHEEEYQYRDNGSSSHSFSTRSSEMSINDERNSELAGEDEAVNGKMKGWKSFKAFYGYGLTRSKDLHDVVGGHQISSSSRHVSA